MKIVKAGTRAAEAAIRRLETSRLQSGASAERVARRIISDVRKHGDRAVSDLLERIDKVSLAPDAIRIVPQSRPIDPSLAEAIEMAIERVERFHRQQAPISYTWTDDHGASVTHRVRPLRRVGIYVPGGRAVYLSTLIMCAVPARIAGVGQLVVATTPAAAATPELQFAAARLGVAEIYRCGGAGGVAALALGTPTLERVDKIVGPGNQYVTAAKQLLVSEVGIDMLAGPTELVLIADESADPMLVAADLLAQAEHGENSSVVCVAASRESAAAIDREVKRQLAFAAEGSSAPACIAGNGLIVIGDRSAAIELSNRIAPEHLSIHCADAPSYTAQLENCGAIFEGATTPVAAGDYIIGPNHVLPTGGTARFTSPLGVYDFVKRSNIAHVAEAAMALIAPAGEAIARFEGLPLHAESLRLRGRPRGETR
jgi:histidinol dehydrogenase